ncbi:MAG: hypothetical protein VYE73_17375 [Acidobacteriota bacterium]|nr:hypothetical protein [Acidobacteriota bacterium]
MPTFEILLIVVLAIVAGVGALGLYVALRGETPSAALEALGRGEYREALSVVGDDTRDDAMLAAATAARHCLEWEEARTRLRRVLEGDPRHGEAMIELALVHLYQNEMERADRLFVDALGWRSDLLESITLHRAVTAILGGDPQRGRELFEEVEATLETKLRLDVGEGEPAFAEWFLHSAVVWDALGRRSQAEWAWQAGRDAAPQSRLAEHLTTAFGIDPVAGN